MFSMFSLLTSMSLDKKDTIHSAQQVSIVALFVHGCDGAGNLAAPGHRAVNACSAPLSALAAEKNSRVHGSCTYSATLTAPRAVAMPTAPAVPDAPKMHAAPCLEPRTVAAPTLLAEHTSSDPQSESPPLACIGAEQRRPHPSIQRPPLLGGNVFATPCTPRFTLHAHHAPVLLRPGEVLRGFLRV